jgi:hypothetical protein
MKKFLKISLAAAAFLMMPAASVWAAGPLDTDGDGLSDADEAIYGTDPERADTDGDGYGDGLEIAHGYSPLGSGKMSDTDTDGDGLSDADEIVFKTSVVFGDSDLDSYRDGIEVENGYDPASADPIKLKKRIDVSLARQELTYYLGDKPLAVRTVSTGKKSTPTPVGTFSINNKAPRAWSPGARLWMPWWMSFKGSAYGLHELPEWPGGKKEGANHLGKAVSGGCIRLGVGAAKELYDWAEIGTQVVIHK